MSRQRVRIVSPFSRRGRHRFPPLHLPSDSEQREERDPVAERFGIEAKLETEWDARRRRILGRLWGRR
jgi:hypothetical protein